VFAKLFYDDLVVVYSGKYLKYGKLIKNRKKSKHSKSGTKEMDIVLERGDNKKILQDIKLTFGAKVEIVKIIETQEKNWLQIITRCHE